ncbi:MAG: ABC transporter permease [Actinobacteria bacterium]|nr:ABC transporter permease [Actinomycetota bacterium]
MIARRFLQLAVVLLLVTFFTFSLVRLLPGDPAKTIIPFGSDQQRAALAKDLGLDKPFLQQYVNYLGIPVIKSEGTTGLLQGNLGRKYSTNQPVGELIKQSLPVSIQLVIYAQLVALALAIPLGVLTAYRAGTRTDRAVNTTAFGFLALPNFVLALLLSYVIGARLKWLPTAGYEPGWLDPLFDSARTPSVEHLKYMVLPVITLAVGQVAIYMRLLRSDMIATLQENFITMAKAKGVPNRRILFRHALRPSSLTLLTVAGLNVGTLIGGAIVVEVIFGIPGMGTQIATAIAAREYVELQSYIFVLAFIFVLINFVVDFCYILLDPRIRRARADA